MSLDGSDDDCWVVETGDAPPLLHSSTHVQQPKQQHGGGAVASFSLVGAVVHTSGTLDSGHYYAGVDDASVQRMDWDPRRVPNPSWSHMAYLHIYGCSTQARPSQQ